MKKLNLLYSQK